jgi:hypothetical protein
MQPKFNYEKYKSHIYQSVAVSTKVADDTNDISGDRASTGDRQ